MTGRFTLDFNLHIDPEFATMLPELSPDEFALLEGSILKERRAHDPIKTWAGTNIIIDGRNRYSICKKHRMFYRYEEIELPDRAAVLIWIYMNQQGRRNMTPAALKVIRGKVYNEKKRKIGSRGRRKLDHLEPTSTAEEVAAEMGVSGPTIKRNGKVASAFERLAPWLKTAYASGKMKVSDQQLLKLSTMPTEEQLRCHSEVETNGKTWSDVLTVAEQRPSESGGPLQRCLSLSDKRPLLGYLPPNAYRRTVERLNYARRELQAIERQFGGSSKITRALEAINLAISICNGPEQPYSISASATGDSA